MVAGHPRYPQFSNSMKARRCKLAAPSSPGAEMKELSRPDSKGSSLQSARSPKGRVSNERVSYEAKRTTDDDAFATDNPIATLNSTILGRQFVLGISRS